MKLHHCAYTITKNHSKLLQDLCESLDAKLIWEGYDQGREIAMQFSNGFCIQFSEVDQEPTSLSNKKETHLAFSSENPGEDFKKIESWFNSRGVKTIVGKWSQTELWIDCPAIFYNFVIEILKTS